MLSQGQSNSLDSLLIQPVQRIPRYRLLFGELLKYTPKDHPDYESTVGALRRIEEVAIHVNESVRDKENQEKLLAIEESFSNKCPVCVKHGGVHVGFLWRRLTGGDDGIETSGSEPPLYS